MTKQEAMQAMNEGKKVTHRFFDNNEFIYIENGMIHFENGIPALNFWQYRNNPNWEANWSIFQ